MAITPNVALLTLIIAAPLSFLWKGILVLAHLTALALLIWVEKPWRKNPPPLLNLEIFKHFPIAVFSLILDDKMQLHILELSQGIVNLTGTPREEFLNNPLRLLTYLPQHKNSTPQNQGVLEKQTGDIRSYTRYYMEGDKTIIFGFLLKETQAPFPLAKNKELESTVGKLINNLIHQFRSPMNSIVGMSELLEGTPLNEEQIEYLNSITSSSNKILFRMEEFRDFSLLLEDRLKLEQYYFDTEELIHFCQDLKQNTALRKKRTINLEISNPYPSQMVGDLKRFKSIIEILANNAIEYCDKKPIKLELSWKNLGDHEGKLEILISDDGIGFPDSFLENFHKNPISFDAPDTRSKDGMGVGLKIVKMLIQQMEGSIDIRNLDQGAMVKIAIPTYYPKGDNMESHKDKNITVLLAEDNKVNQNVQMRMLQKQGCHVLLADDGRQALEIAGSTKVDIIFMDCQMPEMDGIEATKEIRRGEKGQHTPIVALTGYGMPGDRERFIEAGMDDLLTKPIRMDDFKNMLDKWASPSQDDKSEEDDSADGPDKKVFNLAKALELLGNDSSILKPVVETYLEDIPDLFQNLKNAVMAEDILQSRKLNHSLIGASTAVAADKMNSHLELLRKHLKAENLASAKREVQLLDFIFEETVKRLENYLNT